jgi:YVTN family beta-propeller protein
MECFMPPPYLTFNHHRSLLATVVVLLFVIFWLVGSPATRVGFAQGSPPPTFRNFEAPQIHPLALTPDGTRLLAVNSPNASLSIFQLVSGSPVLTAEIPVGLEPVSVAVRNNREAWVVNWLSDSVSIVDLTTGNVTRTLDVGDEPTDVVFAGPGSDKAFVCVSGGALEIVGFSQITGATGAVKVFDANNPLANPVTIENFGKQPRALARNSDGSRVFVSVFESGNQTTIVPEATVTANGGLPPPNPAMDPSLPTRPNTGLIVKWDGSNWKDEISRSWTADIPYTLADVDLLVIDASTSAISARVRGIGTHVGNMAFNPSAQQLLVANLDDINQVRFEPNLSGRFQANRVSVLNTSVATPTILSTSDLNPHVVDFGSPGSDAERAQSLALPADIVRESNGTVYVAATSSARVGVLSSAGAVTARIGVGQGPTGLALDEARQHLYVLNRFDQTLSVVDTLSKTELSQVSIGFNPEPASVRDGRHFLYDATSFSSHGTVSCASCHLNGHRDGMVWDLGNPLGAVDPVSTFLPPSFTGADNQHPMKGPMMTQSLRGIIGNEPFHWRGDRGGLENFNVAFVSLLGGPRLLSNQEMASFKAFVQSLVYPPNPNHPQRRTPNEFLGGGFGFFSTNKLFGPPGPSGTINCSECHLVTNFNVGSDNKITPAVNLTESQSVKVAPFRGIYQKVGMDKTAGPDKLTGFGFSHDGSFDNLFNFQKAPQFNFGQAGSEATADSWRRSIEAMILEFDTGTAPAVGLMVTVDATNKSSFNVTDRINNVLVPEAQVGNCDLVVRGIYGGSPHSFLRLSDGMFQPDSRSEAPVTLQTLLNAANTGAELTFMGVPPGEGTLFALDRNGNGILNDDEPRTSVSITGRVVNASGAGLAGVTVTLSGTQSATSVTDALGRFVFNFISTTGTHTVTPLGGPFTPQSTTFTNPIWNQSATFSASPTGNLSDISQFFVSQHYADFLNREPDPAGLAFWIDQIESCGTDQDCRRLRRDNVSGAFFLSIEFQETGFLAYRAYKASFGDINPPTVPVPVTFPQLMTDTQRIGRNVIVNPSGDWQPVLEANKVAFFTGWVQRPEFLARFPVGMSAADFVNTLNTNTGNSLTPSEAQALIDQLAANNTTQGRAATVRQVSENAEFTRREKNKAFVLMQYFGYLRRNPNDPPEIGLNFAGYNFWLTKLTEHDGNFIQAEMVKSFIVSGEYRQRFGL